MRLSTTRFRPHDCAILGVDTAANSGVAVRIRGRLAMSCEVNTTVPQAVTEVVTYSGQLAARAGLPLCVVLERPWGGSTTVLVGLGMARERWMQALSAYRQPKRLIVSVMPNTWRAAVFGGKWTRVKRDEIRAHELRTACAEAGRSDLGSDEAAAVCISRWGAYAAVVGERLGRRD